MFTGIIQSVGEIMQATPIGNDIQLAIITGQLDMADVALGDSIAVNGVCLTVIKCGAGFFEAHVSHETLSVTVGLNHPQPVNLEKALRLNDRLGGHLVSGHVDGIGEVVSFEALGDCWRLRISAPHALSKYICVKGSICINGVSLTVNTIANDIFSINLIPHTLQHTTLQSLAAGQQVNIEVDQVARYIERMTQWQAEDSAEGNKPLLT